MTLSLTRIKRGASAEMIPHKKNRAIAIIILAFAGVIYGFGTSASRSGTYIYPSGLAIFLYFVSLISLYSACTGSFKDMHDRPSADVQMAMPLSSAERYLSRLLTICYIWVFPFLISSFGGTAIAAVMECVTERTEYVNGNVVMGEKHPEAVLIYGFKYIVWFMAAALFIIAVTVICQCCTGSKAESRYTPVLLMFVFSVMPYAVYELSDKFGSVTIRNGVPFYYLWSFSQLVVFEPDDDWFLLYGLINCAISIAVIAGGIFIYRKKDARSVGMPISFPLFLEVTVFTTLMMLFCVVHGSRSIDGIVLFLAWLGTVILRIICARKSFSFKKVGIWTGLFAVYYIVFLILMFIMCRTGCFGIMYRKAELTPDVVGSHMQVRLEIAEDSKYRDYYSYNDHEKTMMDHKWEFVCSGNNENAAKAYMDVSAKYAMKSANTSGLFSAEMFGKRIYDEVYKCSVQIYTYDKDESSYNWRKPLYTASFCLKTDDASAMVRELYDAEKLMENYVDPRVESKFNKDYAYDYY